MLAVDAGDTLGFVLDKTIDAGFLLKNYALVTIVISLSLLLYKDPGETRTL